MTDQPAQSSAEASGRASPPPTRPGRSPFSFRLDWSALIPLLTAVCVAYIGYLGNQQTQANVQQTNDLAKQVEQNRVLDQQRQLQATADAHAVELKQQYIPKMLSGDPSERRSAIFVYQEVDPAQARSVLIDLATMTAAEAPVATGPLATPVAAVTATAATLTPEVGATAVVTTPTPEVGVTAVAGTPTPAAATALPAQSSFVDALRGADALSVANWVVVAGSDADLNSAEFEVERAKKAGYNGVTIYERQGLFATTIGPFPTEFDARSAQIAIRSKIRDSAFTVNVLTWCPGATVQSDQPYKVITCPN